MVGITGIGSGINIKEIVDVLVASERAPKAAQLDRLEKTTVARISALGTLTGALNNFKSALDGLNKPELFEARTATSSNTSALRVTAASTAPAGSYSVQVQQLAASSKVALQSVQPVTAEQAPTFNSGTLDISVGSDSFSVDITAANNTLAGMRDAINEAGQSSGVSATIVTDDSGSRLVLSSSKTGEGNDIRVAVSNEDAGSGGDYALNVLAFEPEEDLANPGTFLPPSSDTGAGGVIAQARSARLTIDGLQLVRPSNEITDALEGVTLNLAAAQSSADLLEGKTINVNVGVDKAGVKANLQKFVDAYNSLINTTSQLTAVVPVDGSNPVTGPLLGDSSVRNLVSGLRNEMVKMLGEGGVRALADLGISTNFTPSGSGGANAASNGTLSIDDAKLTAALENNFDQVAGYLTGENGLMGRLAQSVSGYVASDGVLKQRTDALNGTKLSIDKQRADLALRVEKIQERLYAQYNAMDSLVGQLTRTSESLTSMLANLPGFVRKDK